MPILGQALKSNIAITDLKLSRLPSVTLQGNEYNDFLAGLQSNTSLTSLNLADTPVRSNALQTFARPLWASVTSFMSLPATNIIPLQLFYMNRINDSSQCSSATW
jgi:hypothetical protein